MNVPPQYLYFLKKIKTKRAYIGFKKYNFIYERSRGDILLILSLILTIQNIIDT